MFVGREIDTEKLNAMYSNEDFKLAVFYGRRRVGEPMLITEFIKDKNTIYYMAIECTQKENLAGLSKAIFEKA